MFEQVIGSPANAFILIVTVIVGFISAMTYLDAKQKAKDNESNSPYGKDHK